MSPLMDRKEDSNKKDKRIQLGLFCFNIHISGRQSIIYNYRATNSNMKSQFQQSEAAE